MIHLLYAVADAFILFQYDVFLLCYEYLSLLPPYHLKRPRACALKLEVVSAALCIGVSVLHHLVVLHHLRRLPLNQGCGLGMLARNYLNGVEPLPPRGLLEVSHLGRHIICRVVLLHGLVVG